MRMLTMIAMAGAVLSAAGCGPSMAYFAPSDPAGKAKMQRESLTYTLPKEVAKDVQVDLRHCMARVVRDEQGSPFTLVMVEVTVRNKGDAPITVQTGEATVRMEYQDSIKPARVDRKGEDAAGKLGPGKSDSWRLHFKMGPPRAVKHIQGFRLTVPVASGEKTHDVVADFKRHNPYRNRDRYAYPRGRYGGYYYPYGHGWGYYHYRPYVRWGWGWHHPRYNLYFGW